MAAMVAFVQKGTGALRRTLQNKLSEWVSITDYTGVVGDGVTNCTDGICAAIRSNTHLVIPEGTFVCSPTAASGDFMLYIGIAAGRPARDGLTIRGLGPKSVLKLADNVGRNALLFGAGNGDTVKDFTLRDMTIDLNGLNNLQTSFNDPLRYNSAAYFFCRCENVLFENVTFINASGHQPIRVGDDTGANYGKNVRVKNCRFYNYGMGVPGNQSQDTSALYIQADGIEVTGCTFENDAFTYDPARGHTGVELHGDGSTIVSGNRFINCQLPWLMASSKKASKNITIAHNRYTECFYLGSLDGLWNDQKVVDIGPGNNFISTKSAAAPLRLGFYAENQKNREAIRFFGNQVSLWGNPNEDVHLVDLTNCWVRSLEIFDNYIAGLTGSVVFMQGAVRNDGYMDLSIRNNTLDSLGSAGGSQYPNFPTFLHIETTSGTINTLRFTGNELHNSALKNYSAGMLKVSGGVNVLYVKDNPSTVSSAYPLFVGAPTGNYQRIDQHYVPAWFDGTTESSDFRTLAAGGARTIGDFTGWTSNDYAAFQVTVFSTDGNSVNNGMCHYSVVVCGSGKVAVKVASTGVYATDLVVLFNGNSLQVKNNNGAVLYAKIAVSGHSSRGINVTV
jgi:hypothetical protein